MPLVNLFCVGAMEQAAGALRDPAVCAKIREFIAEEGGITPLVELLKSDNIKVVRHAAGALANMSMNINNKTRIVQDGALPRFIALLRSQDEQVQELAAVALRNHSVSSDNELKAAWISVVESAH